MSITITYLAGILIAIIMINGAWPVPETVPSLHLLRYQEPGWAAPTSPHTQLAAGS